MNNESKKILVVLTGGTIGSLSTNHVISANPNSALEIVNLYHKFFGKAVKFEVKQPLNILSEDLTPSHWQTLQNLLQAEDLQNYRGVIITHGSDTLPYTSAFLAFMERQCPVPLVLIAANHPLNHKKSNGLANFQSAVALILAGVKGIFTVYQNHNGENVVYLPTRILEADPYNDNYASFGGLDFGKIVGNKLVLNEILENPSLYSLNSPKQALFKEKLTFENRILLIRPYPALDYSFFDLSKKPKAILHTTYHSGTACTENDKNPAGQKLNYSLLEFQKRCRRQQIDFYFCCLKSPQSEVYDTSKAILAGGALPLYNISTEAAVVKLFLAYNQREYEPAKFMAENYYYEHLPNRL